MKALVTGSAGFIGSQVCKTLNAAGYEIRELDVATSRRGDVRDFCRDNGVPPGWSHQEFDVVVHCAAVVGGRKIMDWTPIDHAQNLEIDAALFQWAARTRPGRVVYFSSSCAYPAAWGGEPGHRLREDDIDLRNPRWPDQFYGWTKLTGELLAQYARNAGVPVSVVRPFSVYGPGVREGFAVRGFAEQVKRRADPLVIWGDDQQVRDYIHVTDVAAAVLACIRDRVDGPVNLGTGRATSLRDLAVMMTSLAGYAPEIKTDPGMPAGAAFLVADNKLLRGFCPPRVALEAGLAEVLRG